MSVLKRHIYEIRYNWNNFISALRSDVGMGSKLQDVEGDFMIISRTESSHKAAKLENDEVEEVLIVLEGCEFLR